MAAPKPQSFENHARLIPLYHGVVYFCIAATFGWSVYELIKQPSVGTAIAVLTAIGLVLIVFYARAFALRVQDRVIRLEMRLRLREILPPDLGGRILEFTPRQLVAMRFAGDAELPALAAAVLRDNIQDAKTIKQMVKDWQADYLRA